MAQLPAPQIAAAITLLAALIAKAATGVAPTEVADE